MKPKTRKNNILFLYIFLSVLAIIVLPSYVIFLLPAKFNHLIVENTKNEAVRVSNHLVSFFLKDGSELASAETILTLKENDNEIRNNFHIAKLKLFLPTGEIIYSTNAEDIGQINTRRYFFDIVAKGHTYPMLVKKNTQSLEGQKMQADVVETYIPIMKDGVFLGAFEIYYDITDQKAKLHNLMVHVYFSLLLISGCLFFIVTISAIKAKKSLDERKEYERKLHEISITDELTGLLNRRGFKVLAEKQLNIGVRMKEEYCLFYADIDNLKKINDNFGHDAGDKCIREASFLLQSTFRKSDIICRLGGDEFAVLLTSSPGQDCENTIRDRLHSNLLKLNNLPDRNYTLRISFGLAKYSAEHPTELSELLARADKLMYEKKMQKKNKENLSK